MKRPTVAAPWAHTANLVAMLLEESGVSLVAFAAHMGVAPAFIRSLLAARKPIPPRLIGRLVNHEPALAGLALEAHMADVRWRYMEGMRRA